MGLLKCQCNLIPSFLYTVGRQQDFKRETHSGNQVTTLKDEATDEP